MKAVGYRDAGPIARPDSLVDITLDKPVPAGRDLLVEVKAVSVNPVDTKVRTRAGAVGAGYKVLGWDAAGIVVGVGDAVTGYAVGDEVYYAGDLTRPGANSEFHVVDERIVGRKPKTLSMPEAAAIPLTAITAWEMLFERVDVRRAVPGAANAVLIIGAAGGVGSIAIQLVRALTDLTVIATASRPETRDWVTRMGAHHVIDHREPMAEQVAELGLAPRYVAALTATDTHYPDILKLIAPRGQIALIDDPARLDIAPAKPKAITISWEFMFTRPMFATADMHVQRDLLNRVSALVDDGTLVSTVTEQAGKLGPEALRAAHVRQESGRVIGKQVLKGI